MGDFAIWRRLDTPGHDAALLRRSDIGWTLSGAAVFRHPAGPACIEYSVEIDPFWRTTAGQIKGFLAEIRLNHVVSRKSDGWYLNGALVGGLNHLWDLDFGFTPATNLHQLRRAAIKPGQTVDLPVAWFDVEAITLTELPQRYERRDEMTYWYVAPTVPYEGLLEMSRSGFARSYPKLWRMED
jgi:hypothetical protein